MAVPGSGRWAGLSRRSGTPPWGAIEETARLRARAAKVLTVALVIAASGSAIASRTPAEAGTPALRGPVIAGDWPDPEVVADPVSKRLYSFSTNFDYAGWWNVPVRSSMDGIDWDAFEGDALPKLPSWAKVNAGLTWAPGVIRISPDNWRLYFTARHVSSGRQCIGLATATEPQGPYTPVGNGPLVCQSTLGGSIDASPFLDPKTGHHWLYWKSDENAPGASGSSRLWAQRLTSDGLALTGSASVVLTHAGGSEAPTIEGPDMIYEGGRYWLAYSANSWESASYRSHLASCSGPAGPCTRQGSASDPWLGSSSGIVGPGGVSFHRDLSGRAYVAFHGWHGGVGYDAGGARNTHLELVTFDGPGAAPRFRPDLGRGAVMTSTVRSANANFVTAGFATFLDREPSSTERSSWIQRMNDGAGRTVLTNALSRTDEWIGIEVEKLYEKALGRHSDAAGREYWIGLIRDGMSVTRAGSSFFSSAEFYQRSGSTDRGFVSELYRKILLREPDAAGLDHWVGKLAKGASRGSVARGFYDAIESRNQRVHGLYRAILERLADPTGLEYWSGELLTSDDVRLAEFLAASDEFYNRAQVDA